MKKEKGNPDGYLPFYLFERQYLFLNRKHALDFAKNSGTDLSKTFLDTLVSIDQNR